MTQPKIPTSPSELDAEWIGAALSDAEDFAGLEVTGVRVDAGSLNQGLVGSVVRIWLDYARTNDSAPRTLIAKFAAPAGPLQDVFGAANVYERELRFYQELGERAGPAAPRCYYAAGEAGGEHFVLLLEDLAPARSVSAVGDVSDGATRSGVLRLEGSPADAPGKCPVTPVGALAAPALRQKACEQLQNSKPRTTISGS
jgi:hypothetical protein